MTSENAEKKEKSKAESLRLEFGNNGLLQELCGMHDAHLQQIEERLAVQVVTKGNQIAILGNVDQANKAKIVLEDLYELLQNGITVGPPQVEAALRFSDGLINSRLRPSDLMGENAVIATPLKKIIPRSVQQHVYVNALKQSHLVFGVGPAGTGKTFLAASYAVSLLAAKQIDKIIVTRPVVEAGESLGFLPGSLEEKIDPYLRPIFDVLQDTIGPDRSKELLEKNVIEIAPLAYMRGRTLNNAFVLLDEAQNATDMQMKMFLTRLGDNARAAITGDPSQVDLRKGQRSGLRDSVNVLEGLRDIEVIRFNEADVVRSTLVSRIVQAYDERDRQIDMKLEEDGSPL